MMAIVGKQVWVLVITDLTLQFKNPKRNYTFVELYVDSKVARKRARDLSNDFRCEGGHAYTSLLFREMASKEAPAFRHGEGRHKVKA